MSIFNFVSYKKYMKELLDTTGEKRGARTRLAKFLNCQTGYISQVISGATHFSLEHSVKINDFLEHDRDESHFFMLLVHYERAGSSELQKYYKHQIKEIIESRSQVKSRINEDGVLSEEDHMEYYSQWYYSAIHVLVSIKDFQTKDKIKERLKIDGQSLNRVLMFLENKGLIKSKGGIYNIGPSRIHLSKNSPIISKHHGNWRVEALKSLEKDTVESNLHYSSVMTLSQEDALKIKNILLSTIENVEPILMASAEKEIYSMCLDFFEV